MSSTEVALSLSPALAPEDISWEWRWRKTPAMAEQAQDSRNPGTRTPNAGRVCYSSHKPELCPFGTVWLCSCLKIPWYLETNDPSQAVLTGPFWSQGEVGQMWACRSVLGPSITAQETPTGL